MTDLNVTESHSDIIEQFLSRGESDVDSAKNSSLIDGKAALEAAQEDYSVPVNETKSETRGHNDSTVESNRRRRSADEELAEPDNDGDPKLLIASKLMREVSVGRGACSEN